MVPKKSLFFLSLLITCIFSILRHGACQCCISIYIKHPNLVSVTELCSADVTVGLFD